MFGGQRPNFRENQGRHTPIAWVYLPIGCPRIIRTLYFDVLKEGREQFYISSLFS